MKTIKTGKYAGLVRGFIHTTEAWYYPSLSPRLDEVLFGFYAPEGGGGFGEVRVLWQQMGGEAAPEFRAFGDAWSALSEYGDVLARMATFEYVVGETAPMTGKQFCELLTECGFVDMTERVEGECPWLKKS